MAKKQHVLTALFIVIVLTFTACGGGNGDTTQQVESGEGVLSSFTSTDTTGTATDQTIFSDASLTLVNIWATFCSPCIGEMPDLALLNEEYADRGFQVVGIVADVQEGDKTGLATALSIVEQTGANYLHILASESLGEAKLDAVQYVPETIFVDAQGHQIGESYVGAKDYDDWSEIIETLLEEVE